MLEENKKLRPHEKKMVECEWMRERKRENIPMKVRKNNNVMRRKKSERTRNRHKKIRSKWYHMYHMFA